MADLFEKHKLNWKSQTRAQQTMETKYPYVATGTVKLFCGTRATEIVIATGRLLHLIKRDQVYEWAEMLPAIGKVMNCTATLLDEINLTLNCAMRYNMHKLAVRRTIKANGGATDRQKQPPQALPPARPHRNAEAALASAAKELEMTRVSTRKRKRPNDPNE